MKQKSIRATKSTKINGVSKIARAASPTRTALYRFGVIHKEINLGGFPNASDLAEILEVSSKTVLRDIEFMRDQFGFPVKYDPTLKGFCYDVSTEQGFDILYWNSIFDRMRVFGDVCRNSLPAATYSCITEPNPELRDMLLAVIGRILNNGVVAVSHGAFISSLVPLSVFKKDGEWFVIFPFSRSGAIIKIAISDFHFKKRDMLVANASNEEVIPVNCKSPSGLYYCHSVKSADICVCAACGMLRTCSNPNLSRLSVIDRGA